MRKKNPLAVTRGDRAKKERQMLRFAGQERTHTDAFGEFKCKECCDNSLDGEA